MTIAALAEVCDINPRLSRVPAKDDLVSFLPMADVSEDGSTTAGTLRPFSEVRSGYTLFESGDVLVAKITPCFENGKIAQATTETDVAAGSTEFHVVRPRPDAADHRYVLHMLRHPHVRLAGERRMTGSGGQRRVPASFLAELTIPLPPLEEQKRIAAILDKADELQGKRRAAIAHLDSLTQAIFLDMFSRSEWPSLSVEAVAESSKGSIRTGPFGSQLLHSEFTESGVRVLGIDNVVFNTFRWGEPRFISPAKYEELSRYTVHPGDVLVTIMGTCGRVAIAPDDIPVAINTKHLCCITLDRTRMLPDYLRASLLFDPGVRRHLGERARGAVMPGLNMGLIKSAMIQAPPVEEQQRFVDRARAVTRAVDGAARGAAAAEALCDSLKARAFRGEL